MSYIDEGTTVLANIVSDLELFVLSFPLLFLLTFRLLKPKGSPGLPETASFGEHDTEVWVGIDSTAIPHREAVTSIDRGMISLPNRICCGQRFICARQSSLSAGIWW